MKTSAAYLLASAIALVGCADDPSSGWKPMDHEQDEAEEGETVPPGPEVSVCDDGTDGVCGDPSCTADPNCASEPATPGCTPNALPPAPSNMTTGTSMFAARNVAVGNGRVYIAGYANAASSSGRIFNCSPDGCGALPATFGEGIDPADSFLAAVDGAVVWSAQSSYHDPDQLVRANPDGSAPQVLLQTSSPEGGGISRGATVYADYAVFVDVSDPDGSSGGIRAVTSNLMSPPVPAISTPKYSRSTVAAGDSYIAYYANPVLSPTAPYDRNVHIYDLDGLHVGVAPTVIDYMRHMEVVGESLLFMTDDGFYACTLPACSAPKEIGTAAKARGFTFGVRDDRVYFASVRDRGCGKGLDGVLASCTAASLIAGTCTPTIHSTSFHYVNMNSLALDGTNAYFSSKTATTIHKAAL